MAPDISKLCADHLRETVYSFNGEKLKASHAHELVAAYFGYKSRAALLAEAEYPLSKLREAAILAPNVPLMDERRKKLDGLQAGLPPSKDLALSLGNFLEDEDLFTGDIWLDDNVEVFVRDRYLHEGAAGKIMDKLSGVMAETNAIFDWPNYEEAVATHDDDEVVVEITGTYEGSSDPERPFSGDKLNVRITVTLPREAGRAGFGEPHISASGEVDDAWYDPD